MTRVALSRIVCHIIIVVNVVNASEIVAEIVIEFRVVNQTCVVKILVY